MIEDKLLLWKFKRGSSAALERIYDKYERYLLTVATGLLNDVHAAEDVLHDFFVSFVKSPDKIRINGNFRSYLAICVANLAKNALKKRKLGPTGLEDGDLFEADSVNPAASAIQNEKNAIINAALAQLSYEQREIIILHIHGGMKFTQIAQFRNISVNTVRSRYRYGIDKLRSLVDCEVIL